MDLADDHARSRCRREFPMSVVSPTRRLVKYFRASDPISPVRWLLGIDLGSIYDQCVEMGDARVGEQVALVAASLEPRIVDLATDIRDLIQRDIPRWMATLR